MKFPPRPAMSFGDGERQRGKMWHNQPSAFFTDFLQREALNHVSIAPVVHKVGLK